MDRDASAALTTSGATARGWRSSDALALFSVTWAAVTLFHVWGPSGRAVALFSDPTSTGVAQALAAGFAVAALARPRRLEPLLGMAIMGPVTLWAEMPVAGSHWVVAALVDVAFLLCLASTRDRARFDARFVVSARWVLIGFYSFAAFAKLNHAFFTPTVSCGTYYFDELAGSLGLTVHSQAGGGWTHLVPFGVAAIELSVPVLLLIRRTRHIGVVVGLVFHSFIALDQTHLFSDFSSALVALFVLFLPPAFGTDVIARLRRLSPDRREAVRAVAVVGPLAVLLTQWYGKGAAAERLFVDGRAWAWVLYDIAGLALVGAYLWQRRPRPIEHPMSFGRAGVPRWLLVVPVLVVFQGLAPYLEVRTAYAFNMYSNLQTADGESNHFFVTKTLPVVDYESDLVRIEDTNDPGLHAYVVDHYDLPFLQLRSYLSSHRDVALTYVRDGVEHHVAHASEDPALVEPVPDWQLRFFAYRSLDQTQPARCQPSFLPAL